VNIGILAYDTKRFVSDFIQKRDTANFLQARLMSASEYLRAIKELHELAEVYPCLAQALPIKQVYERIFYSNSIEMQQLVKLLMTNTFVGKASFFSRTGRVLAAYTLMNNVKEEFIECMQLIGEVDTAVAVAKLYNSFAQNDRASYSFAEYATQNRPYVQAVDFWNPLVDPRVVVTNSMQLGQEGAVRNIILTGSNRGGKSTLLKATMLNALMAQTITIVPAKRYVATPFARLATYLNVTDDTAAGLSLFQAQVVRAKKLVEMVDALSPEQLGFVIIDEIFTGTGSKKAASAAYKIAEHMAQSDYLCFILATHFVDELTKLEEDTHGLCKNFKVDADKDENGDIVFRHKLEEGISTQNIANELLNDEFESIDFGSDKVAVA
jgi:DNA mismatch repair protein MutS